VRTYCEQQLPNADFKHVKPFFSPQDPSFDTFAGAATGGAEELQVPNPGWHPELQ
jgi:hypothetical protein